MKIRPNLIPRFNYSYSFTDFLYGIKSIFQNNNYNTDILSSIFGDKDFFFTNNGRSSLYVILKALNLPEGSKIGVPLYACTVVFDAIIKAGYEPRFIDIDLNNYTLDPLDLENKISGLDAIIVIHTFGRPVDMDKIKAILNKIPLIEDCAHSLLSEYKGKITGTLGDASFFSLGKYISAGDGGMIILNKCNPEFKNNIKKELDILSEPSCIMEIKNSIFIYLYSFLYHKPWFGWFAYPIGCYIDRSINISGNRGFNATKIENSSLGLFLKKLECFREKVKLQREYSHILLYELQNTNLILPHEQKNTWCNYFLFPILFDNKNERDKAYEYLRDRNLDTAKLYSLTPAISRKFYNYKNDCPNTEEIAARMLTIPNYYSLKTKELLDIICIIKRIGEYE